VATWILEPGHTEAGFAARHMMVTWVRGLFKDIHGEMEFDLGNCLETTFKGEIDATKIWTGEEARDEHLRSADFLDVANHPTITFSGRFVKRTGSMSFVADTELTIRGQTRTVSLDVDYLGEWETPFWVGDENRGSMRRIGFKATTRLDRHDFGVSWQDELPGGGVVVGDHLDLVLDAEAILKADLEKTGAIEHYAAGECVPSAKTPSK
jgi:polyisoprenoid-binding protein YceI